MRDHVQAHAPLEACGLLAGKNNQVEKVLLIENQAKSRVKFRMDPKEQLQAFNWIELERIEFNRNFPLASGRTRNGFRHRHRRGGL